MTHHLLLISSDPQLAARLRRALPAAIPTQLARAETYRPCPDPHGWLLVLLDAAAAPAGELAVPAAEPAPIIWLDAAPLVTGRAWPAERPGRIVDYVARGGSPSKWAIILHQHLAAAYLRRMRSGGLAPTAAPAPSPGELECRLNNALTGIIGNAGLAIDAGRRLPAPLHQRLERIADLALQMREALALLAARQPPHSPA